MLGQLIQAPVAPFRARGNALLNAQQYEKNQREEELAMMTRNLLNQQAGRPQGVDPAAIRRDEISAAGLDTEGLNRTIAKGNFDNQQSDRATSQQEAANYIKQLANLDVNNPLFNAEFNSGNTSPEAAQRLRQMLGAIEGRDRQEERQDFVGGDEFNNSRVLSADASNQRRADNREAGDQALKQGLAQAKYADSLTRDRNETARGQNVADGEAIARSIEEVYGLTPGTIPGASANNATGAFTLAEMYKFFLDEEKTNTFKDNPEEAQHTNQTAKELNDAAENTSVWDTQVPGPTTADILRFIAGQAGSVGGTLTR